MRRFLPLLPAWVIGLWLVLTSDTIWRPDSFIADLRGERGAGGWLVLGSLVVCTVLYGCARHLGRQLLVSTNSSYLVGMGEANPLQASAGARIVRMLVLIALYLLVVCWFGSYA